MMNTANMVCSLVNLIMLTSLALALEAKATATDIAKDDPRVVVVEYDQDGHHYTKVSISPPHHHHHHHIIDNNHNIKGAASVLHGGGSLNHDHDPTTFIHAPKELICDAYGICKHKIADAIGRAKDKISEKAHDAIHLEKDMIHAKKETAREAKQTLAHAVGKAKETVYNTAHDVHQQTQHSFDKAKETGQTLKDHVVRNVSEAKGTLGYAVKHGATNYIVGSMETLMRVANLAGLTTAYGMNVWITFISSYVLSRAMPRKAFGVVQSKIYPLYFRAMAYSIGIALLGHVFSHRKRLLFNMPQLFQPCNLLASLFTVFINSLYLGPRTAKLISERVKIEKEEGRGREEVIMSSSRRTEEHHHGHTITTAREHDASRIMKLNEKLKRLNSYSSLLNILTLISLTFHLLYLATNKCMH